MRIGQLARKYDVSIEDVISFIKEIGDYNEELNPNSKLDKDTNALLVAHFGPSLRDGVLEELEEESELEEILQEPIIDVEDKSEETQNELDILLPESEYEALPKTIESIAVEKDNESIEITSEFVEKEGESIATDELLALLESEESEVDLSNITLIKASKKELSGLKVLGKIELEEAKSKTTEKVEAAEEDVSEDKLPAKSLSEREQLSLEEREEKRLMFKKRREDYEARQENLEREKQERQQKAIKKAHYEGKIKNTKPIQTKKKIKTASTQETPTETIEQHQKTEPKSIFGKLWRWLDSPS